MAILITERDVRAVLSQPEATADAIAAMERLFREQAADRLTLLPRIQLAHPDGQTFETPERSLRLMPCIAPGLDAACVRIYTTLKVDSDIRTPCEMLLLVDLENMKLRALIEDHSLHTLRTAAPTGVATRYLARPDACRVAVLGTGRHARGQLAAVASVRRLQGITVFGRDPGRLDLFCQEMGTLLGSVVRACATPEEAVSGADIVIVATTTTKPVLKGQWLTPGMHVNSIAPCELDEEVIERARIFPAYTRQLTHGTPTWTPIPQMLKAGRLRPSDLATELSLVVSGQAVGREKPEDITLFLSTGMAGWDVAIAIWIEEWTRRMGLGAQLWDSTRGQSITGLVCPTPSPLS